MNRRQRHDKRKHSYCEASGMKKIRFRTLTDAKRFRAWFKDETGVDSRIYRCPVCRGYHLTTKNLEAESTGTRWRHPSAVS